MNNLFSKIYRTIGGRIFGENEVLNTDIHPDILKIVKVSSPDATMLEGKMFKLSLDDNTDIFIIREINSIIYMNILLVDDKRSVVCSIPYDLYDYDKYDVIKLVKQLYTFVCGQLMYREGDSIYNSILTVAPVILTLHTLKSSFSDVSVDDFYSDDDEFSNITKGAIYDSLDYNIGELLDYAGILAILGEHIKKAIDGNENEDS